MLQTTRSQTLTHNVVLVAKRKYFTTQWKLNFSLSELSSILSLNLKLSWSNLRKTKLWQPSTGFFDHSGTRPPLVSMQHGIMGHFHGGSSAVQRCFWNQRNSLNSRSRSKTFRWGIRIYRQSLWNLLGWRILPKDSTLYRSFWGKFCSWREGDAYSLKNCSSIDRER